MFPFKAFNMFCRLALWIILRYHFVLKFAVWVGFFVFILGYGCSSCFFSTYCVQQVCFEEAVMKTTQISDTDEAELVETKTCY